MSAPDQQVRNGAEVSGTVDGRNKRQGICVHLTDLLVLAGVEWIDFTSAIDKTMALLARELHPTIGHLPPKQAALAAYVTLKRERRRNAGVFPHTIGANDKSDDNR